MTTIANNPQRPFAGNDVYVPDQLIAGNLKLVTDSVTVSAGTLVRGTVMGKKTIGAATSAAKSGGNTGNGTFVLDATTPVLANAQVGVYSLRCIEAVTNGGKFVLLAPNGLSVGTYIIVAGASGTITINNHIKGVLTDSTTDFAVGDGFDITIAAGDGTYIAAVKTATNGSQNPVGILVDACDASGGSKVAGIYVMGEFNSRAITYDNSFTLAEVTALLQPLSIFIKTSLSAAAPT